MAKDRSTKKRADRSPPILALILGLVGGILGCAILIGAIAVPSPTPDHPLLEAPFLTLVGLIIFVVIFHSPLYSLLSRGGLTIKWGDKEISLSEIEQNVDKQTNEVISQLSDMSDEIDMLRKRVDALTPPSENAEVLSGVQMADGDSDVYGAIKTLFPDVQSNALAGIVHHLGTSKYTWRNQSTISKRTAHDADHIDALIQAVPAIIIRSQSKTGNVIYGSVP